MPVPWDTVSRVVVKVLRSQLDVSPKNSSIQAAQGTVSDVARVLGPTWPTTRSSEVGKAFLASWLTGLAKSARHTQDSFQAELQAPWAPWAGASRPASPAALKHMQAQATGMALAHTRKMACVQGELGVFKDLVATCMAESGRGPGPGSQTQQRVSQGPGPGHGAEILWQH